MDSNQDLTHSLDRRRFMMFGGGGVLSSAVLAACAGAASGTKATPTTGPTTTTPQPPSAKDVTMLRTAMSIEALAVSAYDKIIKGGQVTTPTLLALLKQFQSHHKDHGELFGRNVLSAGGTPVVDPNPVLLQQVTPRLAALKTEKDVINLAYDLEHLAAATYQADIGGFDNGKYNVPTASVGGTEARHVALLALLNGTSTTGTPDGGFQKDQDAVNAGTGV